MPTNMSTFAKTSNHSRTPSSFSYYSKWFFRSGFGTSVLRSPSYSGDPKGPFSWTQTISTIQFGSHSFIPTRAQRQPWHNEIPPVCMQTKWPSSGNRNACRQTDRQTHTHSHTRPFWAICIACAQLSARVLSAILAPAWKLKKKLIANKHNKNCCTHLIFPTSSSVHVSQKLSAEIYLSVLVGGKDV